MRKSIGCVVLMVDILIYCTCFLTCFSFSSPVSAESKTATASITVPEACTMTSTNNTPHTATLSPNTYSGASGSEYQNGIGKTTLTATCNDDNGFAIYAIGYTGNSYDSENHNKLVGQSTNVAINTAVYTSGDTTSSWSMKVNKIDDSTVSYNPQNMSILDSFDSWHIVPDTYTKVAQYKASTGSSTTDTTLGAKVETTYAAYIASNQPADTYVGQVKYTMVHPYNDIPLQPYTTEAGCIRYYPNGSNVEGTMGCQPITASATSATLLASNFSRSGYGFAGWSNKFDYATNTDQGLKFYGPQEDITFTAGQYTGTNKGLSLYAVWVKSEGSIQDQSKVASVCNSLTAASTDGTANLSSVSALTDQRDDQSYAIARLSDGRCWMIENLRLESIYSTSQKSLLLAQGYESSNTFGNFTGLAAAENATFNTVNPPIPNTLYSSDGSTVNVIQGGNATYYYARMPRYNNTNTQSRTSDPTSNSFPTGNTIGGMYSYGNYYTWNAAIASLSMYNVANTTVNNTSICPSNWRLPKSGYKTNEAINDFWILAAIGINNGTKPSNYDDADTPAYSGNPEGTFTSRMMRAFPNNFIYSGYIDNNAIKNRGTNAYYWSSTANNSYRAFYLNLTSNNVGPSAHSNNKFYGYTVRCLTTVGN